MARSRRGAGSAGHLCALATGQPAPVARVAGYAGVETKDAERLITNWPGVVRDSSGRIVGFWGLSVAEFGPHRLQLEGVELSAWCAWDTLFLPELLGCAADVHSRSPLDESPVRLRVSRSWSSRRRKSW